MISVELGVGVVSGCVSVVLLPLVGEFSRLSDKSKDGIGNGNGSSTTTLGIDGGVGGVVLIVVDVDGALSLVAGGRGGSGGWVVEVEVCVGSTMTV